MSKYHIAQLVTIVLVLNSINTLAQNWDPFPMNQSSFYGIGDSDSMSVIYWQADSNFIDVDTQIRSFNTSDTLVKLPKGYCAAQFQNEHWNRRKQQHRFYKQIRYDGAVVSLNDVNVTLPFMLDIEMNVGDSFVVPVIYQDTTSLVIKCVDLAKSNVLGVADSIKTFEISSQDSLQTYSNETLVLSKNYGIIYSPSWYALSFGDSMLSDDFHLLGFRKDTINRGYQMPDETEFLPYAPGDVLFWEVWDWHGSFYAADSILSIDDTSIQTYRRYFEEDSLIAEDTFDLADIIHMKEMTNLNYPGELTFTNTPYLFYEVQELITYNPFDQDSAHHILMLFGNGKYLQDSCRKGIIINIHYESTMVSNIGAEFIGYYFQWNLIGYKIGEESDGVTLGNERKQNTVTHQSVFPNPSSGILNLRKTVEQLKIFDLQGKQITSIRNPDQQIDLSFLETGLYLLDLDGLKARLVIVK